MDRDRGPLQVCSTWIRSSTIVTRTPNRSASRCTTSSSPFESIAVRAYTNSSRGEFLSGRPAAARPCARCRSLQERARFSAPGTRPPDCSRAVAGQRCVTSLTPSTDGRDALPLDRATDRVQLAASLPCRSDGVGADPRCLVDPVRLSPPTRLSAAHQGCLSRRRGWPGVLCAARVRQSAGSARWRKPAEAGQSWPRPRPPTSV